MLVVTQIEHSLDLVHIKILLVVVEVQQLLVETVVLLQIVVVWACIRDRRGLAQVAGLMYLLGHQVLGVPAQLWLLQETVLATPLVLSRLSLVAVRHMVVWHRCLPAQESQKVAVQRICLPVRVPRAVARYR